MEPTDDNKDIGIEDLELSLSNLTEKDWEEANWPVISFASKQSSEDFGKSSEDNTHFWEQVLNPKNFITPQGGSTYDNDRDILFVVHSFKDRNNKDNESIFKAITTTLEDMLKDPKHLINYQHHGLPCETRSRGIGGKGGSYPTCDFWKDFQDNIKKINRINIESLAKNGGGNSY